MASNLIAGTAQLAVDGITYQLEGGAKYSPTKVKRDALTGQDGFHGWKEMPVTGKISMSIRDAGSLTVANFNAMRNVTITLTLANGKTVIGRNMGTTDAQEVDTVDAKFDVTFEGPEVVEMTT
jgi:hypothetical protein